MSDFYNACLSGDIYLVKHYLDEGVDLNVPLDSTGLTVLMLASSLGNVNIVNLLLLGGNACIDQVDCTGRSAFLYAIDHGQKSICNILIHEDCNYDIKDHDGKNGVLIASTRGHLEIVIFLVENYGVSILYETDNNGNSAFLLAAANGKNAVMEYILDKYNKVWGTFLTTITGGKSIYKNMNDMNAFCLAAIGGHENTIRLLINNRIYEINDKSAVGNTALLYACEGGHYIIAKLLLDNGSKTNAKNENKMNAFHLSVKSGSLETLKLLYNLGISAVERDNNGRNAVMYSCIYGHIPIIQFLLENLNFDYNEKDNNGMSCLMLCAKYAPPTCLQVAQLLLEKGIFINSKSYTGETALTFACEVGNEKLVDLLLAHSADLNVKTKDGYTPFMKASMHGHIHICLRLIRKGADITAINTFGETSLDIFGISNHEHLTGSMLQLYIDMIKAAWKKERIWLRRKHFVKCLMENQFLGPMTSSQSRQHQVFSNFELVRYITAYI
jgi:ankyrin